MHRLGFLHLDPPEDNYSDSALSLLERRDFLPKVATELGIETVTVSSTEIFVPNPLLETCLSSLDHCWWFGCVTSLQRSLEIAKAFNDRVQGQVPLFESPELVEQVHSLGLFYPILKKHSVPQAETLIIPLQDGDETKDRKDFMTAMKKRLPWRIDKKGVFVRTFYGTRKINPGVNIAKTKDEVLEILWGFMEHFRGRPIGGFGIRELKNIQYVWDNNQNFCIPREFRVFVLNGEPIYWIGHIPLESMRFKVNEDDLNKIAPDSSSLQLMHELAKKCGEILDSRFFVVDFAILEDGELLLVEVNPAYCAGWAHRTSLVCVFGQLLRYLVGMPLATPGESLDLCERLGISIWGLNKVCGFFDEFDSTP